MGFGRAGDVAVGHAAVRLRRLGAPICVLLLGGCSALNGITAAGVGASTGAATANPVVGYAVAVGVNAALDELQKYIARVRQGAEQDVIATAVGEMAVGETRDWKIVHDIPMFDDEHGQMQVVRTIDTPLTQCKEVVFTVDDGKAPHLARTGYDTDACRNTGGWKWAQAEPAVERWGYFQHISH